MAGLVRRVPGFRSARRWKQIVAAAVYGLGALTWLGGLWTLGVGVLVAAVLVANPGRLRERLPVVGSPSRLKASAAYAGLALLGSLMLLFNVAALAPRTAARTADAASSPSLASTPVVPSAAEQSAAAPVRTDPPTPVPPTASPVPPTATPAPEFVPVVAVVDGDTLKVRVNNTVETVRLIGIDTPEVVDPRTPVQCFGREASARAKELLTGARVRLQQDPSQDSRDRYGRVLAYVWLEDGRLVNRELIAEGFAHEYTFAVPYEYQASFKSAEREAREQGLGLWSPGTCNGDTHQAAVVAPTPTAARPTVAPTRPPAATKAPSPRAVIPASPPTAVRPAPQGSQPSGGGAPYYANCAAARAAGAAPLHRGQPGYRPQFDRDNDGIACE